MTLSPMSLDKYLDEHHHITESAIGLARLCLANNEHEHAARILDDAVDKIDNIRRNRLAMICNEKGLDLSLVYEIIPLDTQS